jgi:hypothetical protein
VVRRHLKHFFAQSQDNPGDWFLLGLTCTLVVRKRRGLSRQIWRAYQDRSINALVYHPQRAASSRLKVHTNIKLQDATPRIEDSINIHEGSDKPQDNKSYPRSLDSSRPQLASWKPSNFWRIFSGILGSLTPLTLKMFWWGFDRILLATSTLQPSTLAKWRRSTPSAKASLWLQLRSSPVSWKGNRWGLTLS